VPKFAANLNFLFTELPFLARFEAAARAGFRAVEMTNPYEAPAADIARRLQANALTLALFNTPAGDPARGERGLAALRGREQDFQAALATALAYAEVTGGRNIHVLAGLVHQGAERSTYVRNLKTGARTAALAGVDLLIEPISRRSIPGYLLNRSHEARSVIHEVGEPNLGLQFDIFHRQLEEGDVAIALDEYAPLIRHIQIASPPDRGEPDDGELNYRWLFQRIDAGGYAGYVGCEYKSRGDTLAGLRWAAACGVTLG
jgi:hydroxypyruvate isomerase